MALPRIERLSTAGVEIDDLGGVLGGVEFEFEEERLLRLSGLSCGSVDDLEIDS